jgi:hypothetical protein
MPLSPGMMARGAFLASRGTRHCFLLCVGEGLLVRFFFLLLSSSRVHFFLVVLSFFLLAVAFFRRFFVLYSVDVPQLAW